MKHIAGRLFFLLSGLVIINFSYGQDTLKVNDEAVVTLLRQNSIPIKYLNAGKNFSDLRPLKKILENVTVVGLGETTHGTREIFQMKHRLLEFLVKEMNFTALIIEAGYSACQPMNDYILSGKGDRASVVSALGYLVYDTEEFSAMVDWMRIYNQKVPDKKKIRFYGMDLSFNAVGREKVLAYVKKYIPEKISVTDSVFRILASEEDERFPDRLNQPTLKQAYFPLQELITYLTTNKSRLIAATSSAEWEKVYKFSDVMKQWVVANINDTTFLPSGQMPTRREYMGENVLYLIDREPATRFIVWAHNGIGNPSTKNVGSRLKSRLQNKYFSVGFECNHGTFLSRVRLADSTYADFVTDTIVPAEKNLAWYLSRTDERMSLVNLRAASTNRIIENWLNTQRRINVGFWMYRGAAKNFSNRVLKNYWDGIIFIERSTPSHPTRNAMARSINRTSF